MKLHFLLGLIASILFSSDSHSLVQHKSIGTYVERSDGVYVISVESAKSHSFVGEGIYWTCGIVYEAMVHEILMGKENTKKITFAAETPMTIGTDYLVSLRETKDDFDATDVVARRSKNDEVKYQKCLSNLPLLKEDWFFTSEFMDRTGWLYSGFMTPEENDVDWVVYEVMTIKLNGEVGSPWNVKNRDALPFEVTSPSIILKWNSYKAYLQELISKRKTKQKVQLLNN